jgi:hypothetical protein
MEGRYASIPPERQASVSGRRQIAGFGRPFARSGGYLRLLKAIKDAILAAEPSEVGWLRALRSGQSDALAVGTANR